MKNFQRLKEILRVLVLLAFRLIKKRLVRDHDSGKLEDYDFVPDFVIKKEDFDCHCDTYASYRKYIILCQSCNYSLKNCCACESK